jgi:hypothetical protein
VLGQRMGDLDLGVRNGAQCPAQPLSLPKHPNTTAAQPLSLPKHRDLVYQLVSLNSKGPGAASGASERMGACRETAQKASSHDVATPAAAHCRLRQGRPR